MSFQLNVEYTSIRAGLAFVREELGMSPEVISALMKANTECYLCLDRLIRQSVELATSDESLRDQALEKGLEVLKRNFSLECIPTDIAGEAQRVVRQITGNKDPYRSIKDSELSMGVQLSQEIRHRYDGDLRSLLTISILGNAMDFFRGADLVKRITMQPVTFAVDDIDKLETKIRGVHKVLLLADNAGECYFDHPLLNWLNGITLALYVVKETPVQDDLTLDDLRRARLDREMGPVISTGTDTPGLDFSMASETFKQEFISADLVIAKGMGYYETLSEFAPQGKVFHLLMAKCQPVARSLGVPLNSYLAMLR